MSISEEDEQDVGEPMDFVVAQTAKDVKPEIIDRLFKRGWSTAEDGNPFCIIPNTTKYLNPSFLYPWSEWPRRSTLVQRPDFKWEVIERCVQYVTKMDYEGEIEECNGETRFVLTMLRKKNEPMEVLGTLGLEEEAESGGVQVESPFEFHAEAGVPLELQEGLQPEEIEQSHPGGALAQDDGQAVEWTFENKESLVVNGEVITIKSPINMLRTAADFIGVQKGGDKKSLWDRLNQAVQKKEHLEMFKAASNLYRQERQPDGIAPQSVPRGPSPQEIEI